MANLQCRMYESMFPEVDHVVMIKVKSLPIFGQDKLADVELLEYDNFEGKIVREMYAKRNYGISSLLKVGLVVPLKVLRVSEKVKFVDVSDKPISGDEFQTCEGRFTKSLIVHSILRQVAKKTNFELEDLYIHVGWPLYRKYGHAFEGFKLLYNDADSPLDSLTWEIPPEVKDVLLENIKRKMKPKILKIRADIEMSCFDVDGVLHIKEAICKAQAAGTKDCPVKIELVAAPAYILKTQTFDKEQGIAILTASIEACKEELKRHMLVELTVKKAPRVVNKWDSLAEQMAQLASEYGE